MSSTPTARWSADENGHWHECGTCGDVLELIPHNPGPEATAEEDQICLDCGFVLCPAGTHYHAESGDWLGDEKEHWYLCDCGEILGKAEHTWQLGGVDEEKGVEVYYCMDCGMTKEEALPTESQPQTQPTETKPSTQPTDPGEDEGGFKGWIALIVVGVLLVGAVVFVVIGLLKSKKQVGKYSG